MMHTALKSVSVLCLLAALCALLPAFSALAGEEVTVFQPKLVQEGEGKPAELSPTALRQTALELGFAEAVAQSALKMLPGTDPARLEALRAFLADRAGEWVLGYKQLASRPSPDGLTMVLEVDVNRRALRETLEGFGLDRPVDQPRTFTLRADDSLTEEDVRELEGVMLLTGSANVPGTEPTLALERAGGGAVRGELLSSRGAWTAMDADVATVWFALWKRFEAMADGQGEATVDGDWLVVSGWFSPDGALELDRVLNTWHDLVRFAELTEMDLMTEGVTARWRISAVSENALRTRLSGYLPQRGLSYEITAP